MAITGAGEFTIRGFRSGLRDWAGNGTGFPRDIAVYALAQHEWVAFVTKAWVVEPAPPKAKVRGSNRLGCAMKSRT